MPVPPFVAQVFSSFPLVLYPSPCTSTPPPTVPTLWLLRSPKSNSSTDSSDPYSRQAQALARFTNFQVQVRWMDSAAGAPGEALPALHLPNGELLATEEALAHLSAPKSSSTSTSTSTSAEDPSIAAYQSLLSTSLLPAVLACLYLSPSPSPSPSSAPLLVRLLHSVQAPSARTALIAQVKRLRGGKEGTRRPLDLEALERDAVSALGALEAKMREGEGGGPWFGGAGCVVFFYVRVSSPQCADLSLPPENRSPSALDAMLYALLSIVQELPHGTASGPLKEKLERCPSLVAWVKEKKASS